MSSEKRIYSAPTTLNLEITNQCNMTCRHCYNFWRDENYKVKSLSREDFDTLLSLIIESGVFHVILSGGEPFFNFDLLEYACRRLMESNISISVNSNLMVTKDIRMKRLYDAGVDHILTSLNSFDQETNDFMVNQKGAFQKIVRGIQLARKNNIRVSANMIVGRMNKDHVYQTGKLAHDLGCQKIFGTRTVPPVYMSQGNNGEFKVSNDDIRKVLDQLIRVKEDTGIMIGSLVSYPLCFLGDLEKYRDFVGRGCPAQAGHRMSLGVDGVAHACVHEEREYGNVFEIGIRQAYQNMMEWHTKGFRNPQCDGCDYLEICESGCRMSALGFFGKMNAPDPLMKTQKSFARHYKLMDDDMLFKEMDPSTVFQVSDRLRFRKEKDFYLVNIQWGNTIEVETDIAEFLKSHQQQRHKFTLTDFGVHRKSELASLLAKDAVRAFGFDYKTDIGKSNGLSLDPGKLKSAAL